MILLPCVSDGYFLTAIRVTAPLALPTAASAEPLRYLLSGAGVVLVALTGNDFVERRGDVKFILWRDWWSIAVNTWLNGGSYASKRVRYASISYETLGTGDDLSGEDFQNRGTFTGVRFSVFVICSAQITHPARDA